MVKKKAIITEIKHTNNTTLFTSSFAVITQVRLFTGLYSHELSLEVRFLYQNLPLLHHMVSCVRLCCFTRSILCDIHSSSF